MNSKKFLALTLAVMMLLGVLAGCGTVEEEPDPSGEVVEPVGDSVDLTVCRASEPATVDPALNSAVDGAIMVHHFFQGLITWEDNGTVINDKVNGAQLAPGQAESWEKVVNDDGTVDYTFTLRDDIFWSDGEPVTAEDFVYSWQRLVTPATTADYAYMIDMVKGYTEVYEEEADPTTLAVSAPDEKTFVVTLTYDCPYFEEVCAFPATFPVRQDIIEEYGDQWTFDTATYVCNGPYVMSEWNHNAEIKAVKNDKYYDADSITTESITFQLMDEANSILAAYESGTIQFIEEVPVDEVATLLSSGELNVVDYIGTYFVCFNTEAAPFDDARVREAFSLAIDRNYIVEKVTQTGEVPATAYVPGGVFDAEGPSGDDFRTVGGDYYSVAAEDYEANCEAARQLLADAGYPNGEGLPAVEYIYNTNDNHKAIGEALQQMWQTELGVDVTLANQDWNVFMETRKEGNFTISRHGWIADYNDPCSFLDMWLTGGGNNDAQYNNPEYDALIADGKSTTDDAERMRLFHEAEDLLVGEDYVVAPIYFYVQKFMLADEIGGVYYTPLGYFFFGNCFNN